MLLHPAVVLLPCAWMEGANHVTRECLVVLTLLAGCPYSQEGSDLSHCQVLGGKF